MRNRHPSEKHKAHEAVYNHTAKQITKKSLQVSNPVFPILSLEFQWEKTEKYRNAFCFWKKQKLPFAGSKFLGIFIGLKSLGR